MHLHLEVPIFFLRLDKLKNYQVRNKLPHYITAYLTKILFIYCIDYYLGRPSGGGVRLCSATFVSTRSLWQDESTKVGPQWRRPRQYREGR